MKRLALAMAAAVALAGCSVGKDVSDGSAAVDAFHKQLDAGQFAAIDAAAGPEIKASPGGLTPALQQIGTRLGKVKSSNRTGFNDNVNNGDHRLELTYDTTFERGSGTEEFVFRLVGGKPVLIGYHLKSDALKATP